MDINYDELLKLVQQKSIQIFDVREPAEVSASGKIPTAVNIPLADWKTALQLDPEQFQNKYNTAKPAVDDNVVVHCQAGKRGGLAKDAAQELGYSKVRNYPGSFSDWKAKNGPIEH